MSAPHSLNILCTWEIGGELGHLTRLSNITRELESRGHRVTLALRDLSRAAPLFAGAGARLMQAPVWLPRITLNRPIACQADSLLLMGYLEPDGLHALVQAWESLYTLVNPDLILFDFSPTAQLAALPLDVAKVVLGTGFSEPVPDAPLIDWRPYPARDHLTERQERRLLDTINAVQTRRQQTPLRYLSDLYRVDATVITTFPELDIYSPRRQQVHYALDPVNRTPRPAAVFPRHDGPRILAYLKPHHPRFAAIVQALSECDGSVFVACPGANPDSLHPHVSDSFAFSHQLVDLERAMADADLFVGHGNMGSVAQCLGMGKPVVALPIQLEQLLTGKKLQTLGVGVLVEKVDSATACRQILNQAMASTTLRETAAEFGARYRDTPLALIADMIGDWCDNGLPQ